MYAYEEEYFLFVTYTIIQSITSSEMCSLNLTHPSAHTHTHTHTHTWSSGHTHTHLEQWAADIAVPGESWGFGALLKGLTSVVDNSCRSRDSNPQPQVTSPMLYPLEPPLHLLQLYQMVEDTVVKTT